MSAFLLYLLRAGLYLSIFYVFFLLVMRRTTFFLLNRTLLLIGSYLSLLLPAIKLRTVAYSSIASEMTILDIGAETGSQAIHTGSHWIDVLFVIYVIGASITLILYLITAWKMRELILTGESTKKDNCRLVLLDENVPSFSWGRTIVMSRTDLRDNPAIFTHEWMHVKHKHSVDMLLYLPIHVIFWWNPLVWITREELRLLHEFSADEGVILQGIDASNYQLLLVRKAAGEQRFSLANEFQHVELKSRINMMLKPDSSSWLRWSYLALIPMLAGIMFFCNPANAQITRPMVFAGSEELAEHSDNDITGLSHNLDTSQTYVRYRLFERLPSFKGSGSDEFSRWVDSQLDDFKKNGQGNAKGTVLVQFTIGIDGIIQDVQIVSGLREDIDNAVLQAVSASPRWEPGLNADSIPVPVSFAISVSF